MSDKKISKYLTYKPEYFQPEMVEGIKILLPDENYDYPFYSKIIFPESVCDEIVRNFLINGPGDISQITNGDPKGTVSEYIRSSYNLNMEPEDMIMYYEKMKGIYPEIEDFFKVKIISDERISPLGYPIGGRFAFHSDNCIPRIDKDGKYAGWTLTYQNRTLSSILFLTDGVDKISGFNQCTGGELVFGFLLKENGQAFTMRSKKGLFVVFPSHPIFAHEVEPVNDGYRASIVNWYNCDIL
jgi:hypothetical protein